MNTNINWDGHMFTTPCPYSVKKYGSIEVVNITYNACLFEWKNPSTIMIFNTHLIILRTAF